MGKGSIATLILLIGIIGVHSQNDDSSPISHGHKRFLRGATSKSGTPTDFEDFFDDLVKAIHEFGNVLGKNYPEYKEDIVYGYDSTAAGVIENLEESVDVLQQIITDQKPHGEELKKLEELEQRFKEGIIKIENIEEEQNQPNANLEEIAQAIVETGSTSEMNDGNEDQSQETPPALPPKLRKIKASVHPEELAQAIEETPPALLPKLSKIKPSALPEEFANLPSAPPAELANLPSAPPAELANLPSAPSEEQAIGETASTSQVNDRKKEQSAYSTYLKSGALYNVVADVIHEVLKVLQENDPKYKKNIVFLTPNGSSEEVVEFLKQSIKVLQQIRTEQALGLLRYSELERLEDKIKTAIIKIRDHDGEENESEEKPPALPPKMKRTRREQFSGRVNE